uniref:Uncharacterized protein n=1 Tax=Melopsittacus undulatus TaxID=13146 RepID=A0A8V5H413_MELUD
TTHSAPGEGPSIWRRHGWQHRGDSTDAPLSSGPLASDRRVPQDVAALEYRAPHLAAASLAFAFPTPPAEARLLDVACGTGLVAREVPAGTGMGMGRAAMGGNGAASHRSPCPPPQHYDAVTLVGALGEGQVPSAAVPELLRVTKPGGFLCLTTRSNPSNLRYKAELEAVLEELERQGAWRKVLAQEVERWEKATSEEESTQGTGYISGVVYVYWKCPVPPLEEG